MSFLQPSPPPFDLEQWKSQPYLARLKANCQDWAVNGFGTREVTCASTISVSAEGRPT